MKAVLEIGANELNMKLVEVLTALFQKDVTEVIIRKSGLALGKFDKSQKLEDVILSLKDFGHNESLL